MYFIFHIIGHYVFNYIGAMVRFILGTIIRKLFNRKTYTFSECLNGPPEEPYIRYNNEHQSNNQLIGGAFIVAVFLFFSYVVFPN